MCSLGIFGNLVNCISSTNEIAETKLIPRTHTTGTRFSHGTCSPASHTLRREGKGVAYEIQYICGDVWRVGVLPSSWGRQRSPSTL